MRYFETATIERIGYDFYCDIANRIVEARNKKGWTQKQLSEKSKIKLSKLCRIETVQIKVKLADLETLAKCLDVTVNWIIEAKNDSQIGDCLYLVWPEHLDDFKLYQKARSKRMAFLLYEKRVNDAGVSCNFPRERTFVKLVGVPVTKEEIRDKFPKLPAGDEEIMPE